MIRFDLPVEQFFHRHLDCGVEFAADWLPRRKTVALYARVLTGAADDPPDLGGISAIVERTLAKGTQHYSGREFADAMDAIGAGWSTVTGRQSTLVRIACLPEFMNQAIDLVAELLCRPTFPTKACRVAVELAEQELRQLDDSPDEVVRTMIQRLTLGPVFGRYVGGSQETLPNITPDRVREHWERMYCSGRLQVVVAGPTDPNAVADRLETRFAGFRSSQPAGRDDANFDFAPAREHRAKDLEQQYIALTLPGAARGDADFPVEQVLIAVLSGGMSGRLFTEVREKQGLVYSVAAWHEQPRGKGIIHLAAGTTPQRCRKTYDTLLRELRRLSEDLSEAEVTRARDSLVAQGETDDDLTRARAAGLSDDLFHFGRPIGPAAKLDAVRAVTLADVQEYAGRLRHDELCVATLGSVAL